MTGVIAECPVIPPLDPAHFVDIAMFGQAVKADPVAVLSARASQPPFYVMLHGRPHVVICRYDQLLAAFTDHDTFSRVPQPGWAADTFDYFNGLPTVGDSDPLEHSRLRRLMWPAFTPRRMSQVQARLDRLVDGMIDGVPIHRGMLAHLAMGAANLDPASYPDTERFDIRRNPRNIATFGFGPHFCIGHALARTVMRTAMARLVQRFAQLRLVDPDAPIAFGGLPTERAPVRVMVRTD